MALKLQQAIAARSKVTQVQSGGGMGALRANDVITPPNGMGGMRTFDTPTPKPTPDPISVMQGTEPQFYEPPTRQELGRQLDFTGDRLVKGASAGILGKGGGLEKLISFVSGGSIQPNQAPQPMTEQEQSGGNALEMVGSLAPVTGLYNAAQRGAAKLFPEAKTLADRIAKAAFPGSVSVGAYEGTKSAAEGNSLPQVLADTGQGMLLGAGGDLAVKGLGKAVQAFSKTAIPKIEKLNTNTPTKSPRSGGTVQTVTASAPKAKKEPPLPEGISPMSLKLPDTKGTIASKSDKESLLVRFAPARVAENLKKAYYKTVDGYNRINDFDNMAMKSGQKISTGERAYIIAHNTSNAEAIAQRNLTKFMTDIDGNVVGDPLIKIVRQVPKDKWREFEDYLKLNHFKAWENPKGYSEHVAKETKAGRKPISEDKWIAENTKQVYPTDLNMNTVLADKKIAEYDIKYPWMKNAADSYTGWIRQFGENWLVKTGNILPEAWQSMRSQYKDYIPMQRLLDEVEEAGLTSGARRSFADQPSQVKGAKGSERKTIESLETLLEQVPRMVKSAKRNQVMQKIVSMLQKNPDDLAGFAELVDPKSTTLTFPNIVHARVNGERVYVKINDLPLLESITNLTPQGQNILVEGMRGVTRLMKLVTTGINPLFSLGRNVVRDVPMSYVASKSTDNPVVWASDLLGAFVDILGTDIAKPLQDFLTKKGAGKVLPKSLTNRPAYESYKAMGGGQASATATDRNLLRESRAKILPGYYDLKNIKNPGEYAKRILNVPFSLLEKLADVTETVPRLGEYRRILRQEGDSVATRQKALYESKDVTVNFWKTKTAEISSFLDAFVPYFGAAVQGLDKFARIYRDNPVGALKKSFAVITVPTIALYAINHDNPDYQKLSSWVKDTNYLIPRPDGTFVKLPKPREGGMVFGALIERSLRQFRDEDPDAFYKFAETVKTMFVPPSPLTDNILSPIITDLPENKDFAGRPIVPEYQKNLSPGLQYDEKTSSVGKKLGEKFPETISPKQFDYLIKSYTGVIGQIGLPATSEGSVKDTLARMFTADPLYSQDVVSKFYEKKKKLDTKSADIKSQDGALEGNDEKLRKLYVKMGDVISDTNKKRREIEQDKSIDREAKKQQLRALQAAIVSVAEIAEKSVDEQLKIYNDLKRKGKIIEKKPPTQQKKVQQEKRDEKSHQGLIKTITN